jgi:hypothetical protein
MALSPAPDLSSNRRLTWTGAVVVLLVWAALAVRYHDITTSLGDTDDAMRLVRVRELMAGAGWWDQWTGRLQPPLGVTLHWSRLLDAALAGLMAAARLALSPGDAETAVRFAWPPLLIAPGVACSLIAARRLGGAGAVFAAALMLLADMQLYSLFRPGRIDHHNLQILLAVLAATLALVGDARARWAAAAGCASGLGLAIGVEALLFHAAVGASFGLRAVVDATCAKAAQAYGLALAGAATGLFLIQTPPPLWGAPVCDALAMNLVAGAAIAGLGLAAVGQLPEGAGWRARLAGLAVVALLAGAACLALDPSCIRGPAAAIDPRLKPFWFDQIQEARSWPQLLKAQPRDGLRSVTVGVMDLIAAGWLAVQAVRRRDWPMLTPAALAVLAVAASASAYRAESYAFWFGVPVLAAAFAALTRAVWRDRLIPAAATPLIVSPMLIAAIPLMLTGPKASAGASPAAHDRCLDAASYRALAALPPGAVLSEIDLGPFVLAHTRNAAISAPYHRMVFGILAAHTALSAPPIAAERHVRALKVTYLLDCPAHRVDEPSGSLADRLRSGPTPAWLERLSPPAAPIPIFRVRPAS